LKFLIIMKIKRNLSLVFFALSAMLIVFSCKKKKDDATPLNPNPTPATYPNYSNLKVGNYWVYQVYEIDSSGNEISTQGLDSVYIEKDTLINGKVYFKKMDKQFFSYYTPTFIRDSLHFTVNHSGNILFSSQNLNMQLSKYYIRNGNDTVAEVIEKMNGNNYSTSTPNGTFITTNSEAVYTMRAPYNMGENPRKRHFKYAQNIGLVLETKHFFISNPHYFERRLLRYSVN